MKNQRIYSSRIRLLILIVLWPSFIYAQEDTVSLDNSSDFVNDEFSIPFYSTTLQAVTSPVNIIEGDELEIFPSTDMEEMLTGKIVNGEFVNISTRPGNDKTRLRIRGFSYLVLVDGVPRPINEVVPYEVKSVNILKGLSATAMFGSDAIDGIIYIQTKRGKEGEKNVSLDMEYGMSAINKSFLPEWLNSYKYASLYNEARINDGLDPLYSDEALSLYQSGAAPLRYPDEDMYKQIFNKTMAFRRMNLNYGGGNNNTKYFINLNYQGEGNQLYKINSLTSDEIALRSNLDINIGSLLKANVGAFGNFDIVKAPNVEDEVWPLIENSDQHAIWPVLSSYPPNAYLANIARDTFGTNPEYPINPVGDLTNHLQTSRYNSVGRFHVNLDFDLSWILEGLSASTLISYDISSTSSFAERPNRTYALYEPLFDEDGDNIADSLKQYGVDDASAGISQVSENYSTQFYNFLKLDYNRSFGKHSINTGLVNTIRHYAYRLPDASRQDEKKQNLNYSLFYSFDKKYFLDVSLSYTGLMNLPENKRFKLFPTVGAAWVVSEESFLKDSKPIDFLKLRASYGSMGFYDNPNLFLYRTYWDQGSFTEFNNRSETASGSYRGTILAQLGNPSIAWGKKEELNVGMDMVLFRSLSLGFDYYNISKEGMIMNAAVPAVLGTQNYMENIGITNYSGMSLYAGYTYKLDDILAVTGGLNAGYNKSEIIQTNELDYPFPWLGTEGNPADAIYGHVAEGLLTDENMSESSQMFGSVSAGNIKYEDLNTDNKVEDFIDEKMIGNSIPRYNYGIHLNVKFRNFNVYILGYGLAGYHINTRNNPYFYSSGNDKYSAFVEENRWTMENPDGNEAHPRLTSGVNNNDNRNSSYWLIDGGFFKIKNMELSYTFNGSAIPLLSDLKLFLRGTNLLTFSGIKGLDPENLNFGISTYPSMRTFTSGFAVSFN